MRADQRLEELYIKWFNKTATHQEKNELMALLNEGVAKKQLEPVIERIWKELKDDNSFSISERQSLADKILKQWPTEPMVAGRKNLASSRRIWVSAAAILLLALGITIIWSQHRQNTSEATVAPLSMASIEPGKEGAILTLADGSQIVLDSIADGVISQNGNTQITLQDHQIVYSDKNIRSAANTLVYNTMTTPKGRQFQLILPDGTKVWLNAASSIKYPLSFSKEERRVEINGEAYLEIAHDANWPFYVQTSHQLVEAIGTAFNVNAYPDDAVEKTTLIEGSVKVSPHSSKKAVLLHPGQQAKLDPDKQNISIVDQQSEAALAWKNGFFNLENIPFDQVMKQLERWYDIQVLYENGVPDLRFVGGLSRQMKLDALIRTLQASEVHFKMETGRRLVVYQ